MSEKFIDLSKKRDEGILSACLSVDNISVENAKKVILDFCCENNYSFYEKEQTENYIIEFKIKEDERTYYFEALINKNESCVELNVSQTRDFFVFDEDMLKRYLEDHHEESFYQKSGAIATSHKQFTYASGFNQELLKYIIEWLIERNNAACDDSECFLRLSEEFEDFFEEFILTINKASNDESDDGLLNELSKSLNTNLGEASCSFTPNLCDDDDIEDV